SRRAGQAELDTDELTCGQLRRERPRIVLVGVTDGLGAVARDVARWKLAELGAEYTHDSCGGPIEPREDAQERGFPRAARAEHRHRLVLVHRQRETLQRCGVSLRCLVHTEDVAHVDGRIHVPTSTNRPTTSARNARRVAAATSNAASRK